MKTEQLNDEVLMMSVASHNALAKLKIHVERGAEAGRAEDGKLIVRP